MKGDELLKKIGELHGVDSWQDAVFEFINAEMNNKTSSKESRQAVALLLTTMIEEGRHGRNWGEFQKTFGAGKSSGLLNRYDSPREYIQAQGIVYRYVAFHITLDEACFEISKLAKLGRRRIEDFIRDHRDNAESMLKPGDYLDGRLVERIRKRKTRKKISKKTACDNCG